MQVQPYRHAMLAICLLLLVSSGEIAHAEQKQTGEIKWQDLITTMIQKVSRTATNKPAAKTPNGIRQASFAPANPRGLAFDEGNDVTDFLRSIQKDHAKSKRKRQYPGTGFLDTTEAFNIELESNRLTFSFRSKAKVKNSEYNGRGRIDVEYYFKDNIVLLHGRDGLPSMKSDAAGNYLLTREAKHVLLSHLGRIQDHMTLQNSMDETEERVSMQGTFAKVDRLRREIESNMTMLPTEISHFLQEIYKLSANI